MQMRHRSPRVGVSCRGRTAVAALAAANAPSWWRKRDERSAALSPSLVSFMNETKLEAGGDNAALPSTGVWWLREGAGLEVCGLELCQLYLRADVPN